MKKWAKRLGIGAMVLFVYLGIGYQIAVLSWETVHEENSALAVLATTKEPSDINVHRAIADSLWPISSRYIGFTDKNTSDGKRELGLNSYKTNTPVFLLKKHKRSYYIVNMTFFWGPKVILTIIYSVFLNLFFLTCIVIYGLIAFLWTLVMNIKDVIFSMINLFLGVFGSKI